MAKQGMEIGAQVLRGVVTVGPNGARINDKDIAELLAQYDGAELILVAAPIEQGRAEAELKTCYTCGRDYTGDKCPYCAEARARLRG